VKSTTPRFPNLVIIGAMKCATTSLHYCLSLHPDIQMSQPKELSFFLSEENYAKGLDWYASHFRKPALVHGEATPGYAYFPFFSGVAERMARTIPNAKLIYMVRDPIDRVISHYIHDVAAGFEARSLQAAFNYLGVDEAFHTPRFHLRFHQTRFKRRGGEENRLRRVSVQKIIQGLPVELRGLIERILALPVTRKIEMPELDEKLRERLGNYFSPDIESLRRVTGETFSSFRHAY